MADETVTPEPVPEEVEPQGSEALKNRRERVEAEVERQKAEREGTE